MNPQTQSANNQKTQAVPQQQVPQEDIEEKTEKVAQELQINLPGSGLSLPIRFIALFTLIGGMSIIGSMFADIIDPSKTDIWKYLGRSVVGLFAIAVAYGIITAQRWSIWLYGLIVFIGLLINPAVALLPAVAVGYLIYRRDAFIPSRLDRGVEFLLTLLKEKLHRTK